jgi:hypothetical protein
MPKKSKPKVKAKPKGIKAKAKIKASPRQVRLPGMEDAKINEIHEAALDYADVRDQRMELTEQESELKANLLKMMHKHHKDQYVYQNVSVSIVHEDETVKVKVKTVDSEYAEVGEPVKVNGEGEAEVETDTPF